MAFEDLRLWEAEIRARGYDRSTSTPAIPCHAFQVGSAFCNQFHPEVDPARFERRLIGNLVELRGFGIDINEFREQMLAASGGAAMAGISFIREYLRTL